MPVKVNGPITSGTKQNLIDGLRGKPMKAAAAESALEQSIEFAEKIVDKYSKSIAAGEVGDGGSARIGDDPLLSNRSPTILMYGRVQSGKTAAMILTSALCLDNGFRVVIVLTTDSVALVEQTANRFKTLDGPRVFSSIRSDQRYEWEGQEEEISERIAADGIVLVCAKNDIHLGKIMGFLQRVDAPSYPALIFDDEADAATPDTTLKARLSGADNAPNIASAINRRVFENTKPGQEGESLGEIFQHKLYVQVTATPYIFFLQHPGSSLRPAETMLLEAGEGYCGGSEFFGAFDPSDSAPPAPPLVFVGPNELQSIPRRRVPLGLAASIDFFILAAVMKADESGWPREGYKHLSHSSASTGHHTMINSHISRYMASLRATLRDDRPAAVAHFQAAAAELSRTTAVPPIESLIDRMRVAVQQSEIIIFNSATEAPAPPGPRLNFYIGGNILGRGLTVDDLLVTYYVREAKVSQMDTVWQHARMYGYRTDLLDFTRVYVPRRVAMNFRGIHESEEILRSLIAQDATAAAVVMPVPRGTRATRPNAVDASYFQVIPAATAQIAPRGVFDCDVETSNSLVLKLGELGVPMGESDRNKRIRHIPIDDVIGLINLLPFSEDDGGLWNPVSAEIIIRQAFKEGGDMGVYVRDVEGKAERSRARLSGPEVTTIRAGARSKPALAILFEGVEAVPTGWYPTLVMPENSPILIFSPPEDD